MKVKKFKGNFELKEGERQIAVIKNCCGADWSIIQRHANKKQNTVWMSLKISAIGMAEQKANYWIGWSGSRFAQGHDIKAMEENRPELLNKVMLILNEE